MFLNELKAMIDAGKLAQQEILKIYHTDFSVEIKSDDSPVTIADKTSDKIIRNYLKQMFLDYGFLSEETEDDLSRLTKEKVFIIDPLDGTADFVAKNDEFAINIALSYNHQIVAGVIFIPCKKEYYFAMKDYGAYKVYNDGKMKKITVSNSKDSLTLLTSRFHASKQEEVLPKLDKRIKEVRKVGSSYKGCLIAEGLAECNYRLNEGTKEWDIAPMDIIVKEAKGYFVKPDMSNYEYNKADVYNHKGYVIINSLDNIYHPILNLDK